MFLNLNQSVKALEKAFAAYLTGEENFKIYTISFKLFQYEIQCEDIVIDLLQIGKQNKVYQYNT